MDKELNMKHLQGNYSALKFIPTRSVIQVIVEIPIEMGDKVYSVLGFPNPKAEIPVLISVYDSEDGQ